MYRQKFGEDETAFDRDGDDIVKDHIDHRVRYTNSRGVGIEANVDRLATLVGKISDKLGINLLELIDSDELDGRYEYVQERTRRDVLD
jgi:hypothetical protein